MKRVIPFNLPTIEDDEINEGVDTLRSGWLTTGFDADNYFYGQVHSKSTGNRSQFTDSDIDTWAEAQQVELNPAKRKELWRKIWDKDLDMMYRPPLSARRPAKVAKASAPTPATSASRRGHRIVCR